MKRDSMTILATILIATMIALLPTFAAGATNTVSLQGSTSVSVSLVNQDPDPARAGTTLDVRLGVENSGSDAIDDLVLEIIPSYPFELVNDEKAVQDIGSLQAYQSGNDLKIVKYTLKVADDAVAGTYDLKVSNYEKGSSYVVQRSIPIEVKSKQSAEIIHIDKTVLIPGKETALTFTINNVGNAPLRDLTFSWMNPEYIILPVGSDNTKYIKEIAVGESADVTYTVIADTNANPGLYRLDLSLIYDDILTGTQGTIATTAGVYVGGSTDFDVSFSETSGGQMTFSVANIGSNPAYSVVVSVPQQAGWTVSGSNTAIIGNLNVGDYTVASFALAQGATAARSFNRSGAGNGQGMAPPSDTASQTAGTSPSGRQGGAVKIAVAYTDTKGERISLVKDVAMAGVNGNTTARMAAAATAAGQFGARQQQSAFSKYKWYFIGIVLLAALAVSGYFYRRKKLVNPDAHVIGGKRRN